MQINFHYYWEKILIAYFGSYILSLPCSESVSSARKYRQELGQRWWLKFLFSVLLMYYSKDNLPLKIMIKLNTR